MKAYLLILCAIFTTSMVSAKPKLTIAWSFLNIVEGYDHDTKCTVFIDGEEIKTSSVTKESVPNSITIKVKKGKHDVKIMNYASYEGKWEEHTIVNEYSIDCSYEKNMEINKKTTITLVFDIDSGTTATVE